MIKYLRYILIPLLAVILMSHNVFAAVSTFDLNNYSVIASTYRAPLTCTFDGSNVVTSSNACTVELDNKNHNLTGITSSGFSWNYKKGDIVEFDIVVFTTSVFSSDNLVVYVGNGSTYNNLLIFDVTETVNDNLQEITNLDINNGNIISGSFYSHVYHFSAQVLNDFSGNVGLSGTTSFPIFSFYGGDFNYFRMSNLLLWRKNSTNPINDEQKQATQDAADESENTAENSSENEGTSTLSNNLNNIFSTISSTQASNCIIPGNLGHINIGSINLCQGKENFNQLFEFIGYVSLFTVSFWAAYHLINRTIRLIDWARA